VAEHKPQARPTSFHVTLLRAGFDLIDLSGYGRQSTGGANPRRKFGGVGVTLVERPGGRAI